MTQKILKIHHIGIACKDLQNTLKKYKELFNLESGEIVEVPQQKVKIVNLKIGESEIELLEAISPDSTISKFIEKKGEGIHHIAFSISNIDQMLKEIESKNIELIDKTPRIGAHNKKVAFLHPKSLDGVLIELCEDMPPKDKTTDKQK